MRIFKTEIERLKSVKRRVKYHFPLLGINKIQEITRLTYEISKKENILPSKIIFDVQALNYEGIKKNLLERRYPYALSHGELRGAYLPKLELNPLCASDFKERKFYPKNIFVETASLESCLVKRLKAIFPKARFSEILSLKNYLKCKRNLNIKDYNKRQDTVFVVSENYDFFKKCPCTKGAKACGYHIFNLGFGCIFECTYCFLQGYTNSPGIILPANIDKFFDSFKYYYRKGMRIGTGEFSDSLALDDISEYSYPIIDFFKYYPDVTFEFKTKSSKVENLLKSKHKGNIVVSWSLSPEAIIAQNEYLSAKLKERISAMLSCIRAGYKVGFHFDPIIYFDGWENKYGELIDILFSQVNSRDIAWVSLGTFRFRPELKQVIERRFGDNKILDEELLLGYDNKLRYPHSLRYGIYKFMLKRIHKYSKRLYIYLCMEDASMWRGLEL